jgi:hypothetical protein
MGCLVVLRVQMSTRRRRSEQRQTLLVPSSWGRGRLERGSVEVVII